MKDVVSCKQPLFDLSVEVNVPTAFTLGNAKEGYNFLRTLYGYGLHTHAAPFLDIYLHFG